MKKALTLFCFLLAAAIAAWCTLLFLPKDNHKTVRVHIEKGEGISAISRKLETDHAIYNRVVLVGTAYMMGIHDQLRSGNYRLPAKVSTWQILQRLKSGRPDTVTIQIIEGMRFSQMRNLINRTADIAHDTIGWSNEKLLKTIDPNITYTHPEGLFAPDSYDIDTGSSDLQVFQAAYRAMQRNLQTAWDERQSGLPYRSPYELLTMASIVEKETAHEKDRRDVAAVFTNRLKIGMRLQTDPSVIYGMGERYNGRIRKADLRRDTPYNTYTRAGLPPTPISLPGRAALEAAAHPSNADYLYFVSKMDSSGESHFSNTLDEHNAAVRQYILKRK